MSLCGEQRAESDIPNLATRAPSPESRLRQSKFASANSLLLPLFPQMTDEQQDKVLTALFREKTAVVVW